MLRLARNSGRGPMLSPKTDMIRFPYSPSVPRKSVSMEGGFARCSTLREFKIQIGRGILLGMVTY